MNLRDEIAFYRRMQFTISLALVIDDKLFHVWP